MNARLVGVRGLASALVLAAAALVVHTAGAAAEVDKKSEKAQAEIERKLEEARKRLDMAAREVAELSMSMSEDVMPDMQWFAKRGPKAMLGINLGSRRAPGSDEGVEVVSVSPGGAAAEAGLKAGDVLVELNGKALKRDSDSAPREKLMREMREVDPGDKVAVGYKRDGKLAKATLVAQPLADRVFKTFTHAMPMLEGPAASALAFGPRFFGHMEGAFGSAELVPLTPKLGQYFGTDKGLLVVRAPSDSRLQLEDGDVIIDIDGRSPSSSLHALRILSSYQAGEKLELNVLRAKKKMSFDITIPEDAWEPRMDGASFFESEDVLMPTVPAMPALPAPPGAVSIAVPVSDEPV